MDDSTVSTPRTPRQYCRLNAHTPISARKTPGDRFIPSRAGADLQFSAYKVRSGKRSRAENCCAQDNTRTPLADSAKRREVRERLFALRGRSSDSKVLNFKQTPATCTLKQRNGEFLLTLVTLWMVNVSILNRFLLGTLQCLYASPSTFQKKEKVSQDCR